MSDVNEIFYFGKYIGKSVIEVLELDIEYLNWSLKNVSHFREKFKSFSEETKNKIYLARKNYRNELQSKMEFKAYLGKGFTGFNNSEI